MTVTVAGHIRPNTGCKERRGLEELNSALLIQARIKREGVGRKGSSWGGLQVWEPREAVGRTSWTDAETALSPWCPFPYTLPAYSGASRLVFKTPCLHFTPGPPPLLKNDAHGNTPPAPRPETARSLFLADFQPSGRGYIFPWQSPGPVRALSDHPLRNLPEGAPSCWCLPR